MSVKTQYLPHIRTDSHIIDRLRETIKDEETKFDGFVWVGEVSPQGDALR